VRHGLQKPIELYNLKNDLGETKDLAAANPEIVKKVQALLSASRIENPDFPIDERPKKNRAAAEQ
jgi:arylsulfatase A